VKKIAQYEAKPFLGKINTLLLLCNKVLENLGKVNNFQKKKSAQSKQSPKMQKFGQSGHPDQKRQNWVTLNIHKPVNDSFFVEVRNVEVQNVKF
jgi:hypothetical protein